MQRITSKGSDFREPTTSQDEGAGVEDAHAVQPVSQRRSEVARAAPSVASEVRVERGEDLFTGSNDDEQEHDGHHERQTDPRCSSCKTSPQEERRQAGQRVAKRDSALVRERTDQEADERSLVPAAGDDEPTMSAAAPM